jgi:hypothetical protein
LFPRTKFHALPDVPYFFSGLMSMAYDKENDRLRPVRELLEFG